MRTTPTRNWSRIVASAPTPMTARERYLQACADQGIPAIQVSPKVLKECKGFGKLPTFPKPNRKRIDALYAQRSAA